MQNRNAATVAEIDGARVFVTPMGMIFIFGFAQNYLLEKKLRLFYDKIWAIFDPWLQTFPM